MENDAVKLVEDDFAEESFRISLPVLYKSFEISI
jgi:hypothetical protein